jgi:hypothetical protein
MYHCRGDGRSVTEIGISWQIFFPHELQQRTFHFRRETFNVEKMRLVEPDELPRQRVRDNGWTDCIGFQAVASDPFKGRRAGSADFLDLSAISGTKCLLPSEVDAGIVISDV